MQIKENGWISERIENNPDVLDLIQFSDEAHFHMNGHVTKHKMRFGKSQLPHEHTQRPLSQEIITVWDILFRGQ